MEQNVLFVSQFLKKVDQCCITYSIVFMLLASLAEIASSVLFWFPMFLTDINKSGCKGSIKHARE